MINKLAFLSGIVIAATIAGGGTAHAQRNTARGCDAAVDQVLAQIPDISDRVESISFNRQLAHGDGAENRTIGWDVWVRLADFDGALVIDLTTRCRTRQVYTRGKDSLPDIRAHCV